ncbi:YihY/virulence factor BrkB family protein [Acidipropionibacterium virtanenii]|uniref:Inner membrane protein YhjD n=1 Tax=Acidipropionibacterium virtanenii TaxID=2057246 RepID=A0A344UUF6_9ACTN|nr:YhjD/YihY/BrkB family envelope integrity protein [Acidipropionibacterium virtanenii]AXE38904.1 Inner membrane protein YhjD [Acidipropionibacterium virtanenii]
MRTRVSDLLARPAVAHLARAQIRFSRRLGSHFAASIAYFTVLAMVPLLAFAFAVLSLILTRLLPDVFAGLKDLVVAALGVAGAGVRVAGIIDSSLRSSGSGWTVLITVLTALWTGVSWVGHLRSGIRAQWEPAFARVKDDDDGLLLRKGFDAVTFLALLVVLLVAFGTAQLGNALTSALGRRIGINLLPGHAVIIRIGALLVSSLASSIFFLFLYTALPRGRRNWRAISIGSAVAGICLPVVQTLAGLVVSALNANRTVQAFGSIIVVMLVFNVLARIALFVAAWIATADQPAVALRWHDADAPLLERGDAWTVKGHWDQALAERAALESADADGESGPGKAADDGPESGAPRTVSRARHRRG